MTISPNESRTDRQTVLVVDDVPDNLRLLAGLLKEKGYRGRPASSGRQALATSERELPDLVLLDIMMPDLDGYEVCQRLKADSRTADIPVIFMSALHETFNKVRGFAAGGVDYITKPFDVDEVLARVQAHVTLRRQRRELEEQQERFQKLAEASFEGILIHEGSEIVEVNVRLADMLGYDVGELIGKSVVDLIPVESVQSSAELLRDAEKRPRSLEIVKKDGSRVLVELQARGIVWQGREAGVAAMRDISWQTVLKQEEKALELTLGDSDRFCRLVGKNRKMKRVYEFILRAAATDAPVVIYGETGTGKELAARSIFDMSERHRKRFVPVDCASIPENLFESQFFGYKRGSFTGADRDHAGFFAQANGGTIFLDEIGELPLAMQAKLLRVLESRTFTPLGARGSTAADVRIIAATNRDLRAMVRQGRIRVDFFHRIHVLAVDLPPLRVRKDDLGLLVAHFFRHHPEPGSYSPPLPDELIARMYEYHWPGNVRQLFNELRRYALTENMELMEDFAEYPGEGETSVPAVADDLTLTEAVDRFEHYYISRTLERHGGRRTATAEVLGVDRKTLYRKMKKAVPGLSMG